MSKALIAKFLCLNKDDQEWVLKSLEPNAVELLRKYCSEAEALGLTKNADLLMDAVSESQKHTATLKSEGYLPPAILALDDFWVNVYLGSLTEADVNKLTGGRKLHSSGKPIRVSKLVASHLSNYIGGQNVQVN